ncbi:unnamed protein product [Blepharisma stoltei]|uniref:Uncharacterized protein n=1 Tax=Blepharisma stoltei TaxID=1481888 RepID=A0AAU9K2U5_9CILI|nr:unnamed protein product [Blepharisma stoltei]
MFIKVVYGYKQGTLFNINCQTGPLLDAVKKQAFTDITSLISSKITSFTQEVENTSKKIESKQKKLYKLENPPPDEEAKTPADKAIQGQKSIKEENKCPPRQEEFLLMSENTKIEEAKAKAKPAAKKGKKEEVKELSPEEIKQQQLEAQKEELRAGISELSRKRDIMNEKLKMLNMYQEKYQGLPANIDFVDPVGARKFLGSRIEDNASTILNNRTIYQLNVIDADNNAAPYDIDGFCIRTVEEDATYVEEPDPKTKGKQKGKKK